MAVLFKSCIVADCNGNAHPEARGTRGWCRKHYTRWQKFGSTDLPANANGKCQKWLLEHAGYDKAECLIWPFARGPEGYGRVQFRKKITAAHRAICILAHGEPSLRSLHAAHSCGNGYDGCVNPSHLRWASKKENEADKLIHNKHNRGQRHGAAKLTEKDVREIRALRGVLTQIEIAHIYGISPAYVCGLQAFRTWAWVK